MRIFLSVLFIALSIFCFSNLILVDSVTNYDEAELIEGDIVSAMCEFRDKKSKSYYLFDIGNSRQVKVRVSNHKCDDVIVDSSKGKRLEAYFLGGFPLQVDVGSSRLLEFEIAKSENNTLYGALVMFLLCALVYVQFAFRKKRSTSEG